MLSVFITPWTKPTRIHPATIQAVRSHTWANHSASPAAPCPASSGKWWRRV